MHETHPDADTHAVTRSKTQRKIYGYTRVCLSVRARALSLSLSLSLRVRKDIRKFTLAWANTSNTCEV
jgi:hypothetical protein